MHLGPPRVGQPTPCLALCGRRVTLDDLPGDRLLLRARLSHSPPGWLRPGGISSLVTSRAGTCARGTKDTPHHMCCGHLGTRGVGGMTSGALIQNGTLPFESRLSKQAPPTPSSPQHSAPTSLPGPALWLPLAPLVAHGSSSPADGAQLSSSDPDCLFFLSHLPPYNHVWRGGRPILQVERRDSAFKSMGCGRPNSSSQVLTTPPQSPPRTLENIRGQSQPVSCPAQGTTEGAAGVGPASRLRQRAGGPLSAPQSCFPSSSFSPIS